MYKIINAKEDDLFNTIKLQYKLLLSLEDRIELLEDKYFRLFIKHKDLSDRIEMLEDCYEKKN